MKLNEYLLERVRKGELIVENDNKDVISLIFSKHNDLKFYVFKHNGFIGENILYDHEFCKPIIKASELIEKEDYTKPLEEGQLCVFWEYKDVLTIDTYDYFDLNQNGHISSDGVYFKNAIPITGEETVDEIQEKINEYLKDK